MKFSGEKNCFHINFLPIFREKSRMLDSVFTEDCSQQTPLSLFKDPH